MKTEKTVWIVVVDWGEKWDVYIGEGDGNVA
jgi:hypothetical protein